MTAVISTADVETKSHTSYKSTHSSRSSVLERAREYTRKMEGDAARRAKSLERSDAGTPRSSTSFDSRSQSAGRGAPGGGGGGNRHASHERALASLEKENHYHHQRPSQMTSPKTTGSVRTQGEMSASTSQQHQHQRPPQRSPNSRGSLTRRPKDNGGGDVVQEAVVSPELLVDALSGHEDGLLAIAERLMEHYDLGYDAMGEAIIDAFADVQKLFQHVVEAAHMEGAAFEASRREEELREMKQENGDLMALEDTDDPVVAPSPHGPIRHDEFIDQDVKDCLTDAIRKGGPLKEARKYMECFRLYEMACQSASALLPVDSDHRGRLQLSLARAESMGPDRGCAILRYTMDDVLRSGMRAGKIPLPDPSKRADVVLSKPKAHPSMNGSAGQVGVVQSSEEQLNSLVEEMKEILDAPVYKDTPLYTVAKRFWVALNEAQKTHNRNEERLEQNLGKLKGDFLLARAEWEEKLNKAEERAEDYKHKYMRLKEGGPTSLLEEARQLSHRMVSRSTVDDEEESFMLSRGSGHNTSSRPRGAESIASLGSSMAHHARTLVGSFSCTGINERTNGVLAAELQDKHGDRRYGEAMWNDRRQPKVTTKPTDYSVSSSTQASSRSYREYSQPRRVDV